MITTAPAENVNDYRGLSTDTKPTLSNHAKGSNPPANGSTFIEMDTSKVFVFDKTNDQWREI